MTRTLDDLTIGELRSLVHYGGDERTTLAAALAAMTAANETTTAHEAAWAAHQAANAEWTAGRGRAARDARDAAVKAHGDLERSTGASMAAGQEAGTDAAQEYERRVPRPLWNGEPTIPLEYGPAEKPGLFDRVRDLVS